MKLLACWLRGHDYEEKLLTYPRPGNSPPGNQRYRVCRRCDHIPDERLRQYSKTADGDFIEVAVPGKEGDD